MKREVRRERKLPVFSLGIGDIELLWDRLIALFDTHETIHTSIEIRLKSESLQFTNITELKDYGKLRGNLTNFTVRLYQKDRVLVICSRETLFGRPRAEVSASADTEVWCAGAIEAVVSFVASYRAWYSWFKAAPLGWVYMVISNFPPVILLVVKPASATWFYSWLAASASLAVLYLAREFLLPSAVIRYSEEEGFVRRRGTELSVLVALLSLLVAVIGLFVQK